MGWVVRGSEPLDRLLGMNRSADVDVFYDKAAPTEAEVRKALQLPDDKKIDINKEGFEQKTNLDLLELRPNGKVYSGGVEQTAAPSTIDAITKNINCDDAIRILKTASKYGDKLQLGKALKTLLKKELKASVKDGLDDAIVARVQALMVQPKVYRSVRSFLKNDCGLSQLVQDNLPNLK